MSVFTQLTRPRTERLLLVGAGHTHLYLLRHAARLQAQGYDITLVAPPVFSYSGNAVAVALGTLPSSAGRICVATLAQRVGVRHLAGTVREIDPSNGTAVTDIGESIHWDVLTLNIGSVSRRPDIELGGGSDDVLAAKPVGQLRRLAHLTAGADRPVVVVGAGSTGIEVAAQLSSRSSRPITLISASDKIGPGLPTAARDHLHNLLSERGVRILTRRRVRHLHDHCARLEDDTTVPYAAAVLATGLAAPPAVAQWGLGDRRGIPVLESLRHRDRSDIYAAGDCKLPCTIPHAPGRARRPPGAGPPRCPHRASGRTPGARLQPRGEAPDYPRPRRRHSAGCAW